MQKYKFSKLDIIRLAKSSETCGALNNKDLRNVSNGKVCLDLKNIKETISELNELGQNYPDEFCNLIELLISGSVTAILIALILILKYRKRHILLKLIGEVIEIDVLLDGLMDAINENQDGIKDEITKKSLCLFCKEYDYYKYCEE
jgi:hypothetical protein